MNATKIEIEQLTKQYENAATPVIENLNMTIQEGEFIVIVGPSGCGKSTTMRMIAGIETITSGFLKIDGHIVNHLPAKDRDIAMVFQSYALYPHMTVFDNMAFGLKIRKHKKEVIQNKVHEAAKLLGLMPYLKRKPKDLSGGQRQRVALGRAIVRNSPIFLMDEPLSNLDAKLRNQMRVELLNLHRSLKTTTIYVTHDQTEAMTMADRIIVLKDGQVQQIGTPEEIYRQPANLFVGTFLGSPQMNTMPITLKKRTVYLNEIAIAQLANDINSGRYQIGVRPEDWLIVETGIPLTITHTELLGADLHIHGNFENHTIILRCDGKSTYTIGDVIHIMPKHLQLFNEQEQNIYVKLLGE